MACSSPCGQLDPADRVLVHGFGLRGGDDYPDPEDMPFPVQTSLYGASKLAGEGLIAAYAKDSAFRGSSSVSCPFSAGGTRTDMCSTSTSNSRATPSHLRVLGNGRQRKSYLHVEDCVSAMLMAIEKVDGKYSVFNLGTDHYCEVNDSIGWIVSELGLEVEREYTGGERGWIGDNPFIFLDCSRIRTLGWKPRFNIEESVGSTLSWLRENPDSGQPRISHEPVVPRKWADRTIPVSGDKRHLSHRLSASSRCGEKRPARHCGSRKERVDVALLEAGRAYHGQAECGRYNARTRCNADCRVSCCISL